MNVGIILAAGSSSRFDKEKQKQFEVFQNNGDQLDFTTVSKFLIGSLFLQVVVRYGQGHVLSGVVVVVGERDRRR